MMSEIEVLPGDVWEVDGAQWLVVGPKCDGEWPLSGPLPCRGMYQATTADLLMGRLVKRQAKVGA